MQRAIAFAFEQEGIRFEREYRLSTLHRLDFLVDGRIAIECKCDGPVNAVLRQLGQYASYPMIEELVLVTNRSRHTRLARMIHGKPITVIFTVGAM